jgi:ABC-type Fe3+ transport system permease subunit
LGGLLLATGAAAWAFVFIVPLAGLYLGADSTNRGQDALGTQGRDALATPEALATGGEDSVASPPSLNWLGRGLRSAGLSAAVAAVAVLLGWLPGKLLAAAMLSGPRGGGAGPGRRRPASTRRGGAALLMLVLAPLLLPTYVVSYSWRMLLSPDTWLGQYVSSRPDLASAASLLTTYAVLGLWLWPVAALVLAQGWRRVAPSSMEMAHLDAGPGRRLVSVVLPLMGGPMLLAFGACFVLSLCEYTTFHLAGAATIGTDIDILFRLGRNEHAAARSAWPLAVLAAIVATALWRGATRPLPESAGEEGIAPASDRPRARRVQWAVLAALLAASCAAPLALMAGFLTEPGRFRQFGALHWDQLRWSGLVAAAAGLISLWIARTATALTARRRIAGRGCGEDAANHGTKPPGAMPLPVRGEGHVSSPHAHPRQTACEHGTHRFAFDKSLCLLGAIMQITVLLAMFLPASLLAVSLLKIMAALHVPAGIRDSWLPLAAGLTLRYAGLAVIVLWFSRRSEDRQLADLAAVDGATPFRAWLHVHLPRHWPLAAGAMLMIVMLGLTEVPATMLLLPPGLPSFPQWLLDQMHHLRDQHVVAACLAMAGTYLLAALAAGCLVRVLSGRGERELPKR